MNSEAPATRGENAPPFAGLDPAAILDAVESTGLRCDGRLLALNSYENRVWQVWLEEADPQLGASVVVKFYRPGRWSDEAILEEHAFVQALAAAEAPAVPALVLDGRMLHHYAGFRLAVFRRQGGRAPMLEDPAVLGWLGRFLGRIHAVGCGGAFHQRPALDVHTFGEEPRAWLLASGFIPPDLLAPWRAVVDQALDGVRRAFERAGAVTTLRLHGDCHAGNVLWTDLGPHFVDFDDARTGPAVQDLWMLLAGEGEAQAAQLRHLVAGYRQFADFNPRELHLVEALRTLRLIHYSAWIARRWNDPAFPAAFPWFDSPRYWQDRILELREQIPLMDEAPLVGCLP